MKEPLKGRFSRHSSPLLVSRSYIVKMVKLLVALLLFIFASLTGVCPQRARERESKPGEMVVLSCPKRFKANLVWGHHTPQKTYFMSNMSPAELAQMGVLVHGRTFVILSAGMNHQGNYSCSERNASGMFWFTLTVNKEKSKEYDENNKYIKSCYIQESCKLNCPDVKVPSNIIRNGVTWNKDSESFAKNGYFKSVEKKDQGIYTCTRRFLYGGQTYNMTFTVELNVEPNEFEKYAEIVSPLNNQVLNVDLGKEVVIDCKAVTTGEDDLLWFSGSSSLEKKTSSPVFYNYTEEIINDERKLKASLVFKKVSEKDLSKDYTCKLDSLSQSSSLVTITLRVHKAQPSYISLAPSIVGIVVVMVVTAVIYVKLKMDIALFFRDTLGCYRRTPVDEKSYDAFLMCYESDTGLNTDDRKQLENVLEERFGYSLCLYDRDVLPGKATAEAVLDCVELSRTVVLVPTSPDPGLGSGLLSAIHEALVERQTRLILIKTDAVQVPTSGSTMETLEFLNDAGVCVTWRGTSSMSLSSSFWKQLRYYLPALQHTLTAKQDDKC
uniref:Interleukin-18 receptor 1-like n=1 Tax=Echeneis naucrates TaxID=173247 RepID=A0A665WXT0_ECHNA